MLGARQMQDVTRGPKSGTMTYQNDAKPIGTSWGLGLDCENNDRGAYITTTEYNSIFPVSLVAMGIKKAAPTSSGGAVNIFGVSYTSSDSSPFVQYGMHAHADGNAQNVRCSYNSAGTFVGLAEATGWTNIPTGGFFCYIFTIESGSQRVYINGNLIVSATAAASAATAGTDPQVNIGGKFALSRNPNADLMDCRIYNRVITPAEAYATWHPSTRWALYGLRAEERARLAGAVAGDIPVTRVRSLRVA